MTTRLTPRLLTLSALLALPGVAIAFTSTPIDGSQGGVPSFVSSGLGLNSYAPNGGTGVGGGSPFIGSNGIGSSSLPSFTEAPRPVDPNAFGGGWQLQQGRMLFGTENNSWTSSAFSTGFNRGFGLSPMMGGGMWDVSRVKSGYLVNENLLLYSSVGQARPRDIWSSNGLPAGPNFAMREEQRGMGEARAGVQWQALPGLTLGLEVGGVQGLR
ncbi:MAG: hypothetical protein ACRCWO_05525 [Bosea sp. (in: a-proteobacteria)]